MNMAIFTGVFEDASTTATAVGITGFMTCLISALIIGLIIALTYKYKNKYSKNFVTTLALMPAMVCVVIMMVNGNVGAGVAVAGAFSLVRFRSVAGTSTEIGAIFLAMGSGLMTGMGYIGYATVFIIVICIMQILYNHIGIGSKKYAALDKTLRIAIPEDLEYTGALDDLFQEYTTSCQMTNVKTTDMGSLFKLTYNITLKKENTEKEFIDKLRCRNGNLEISISQQENNINEL